MHIERVMEHFLSLVLFIIAQHRNWVLYNSSIKGKPGGVLSGQEMRHPFVNTIA